MSVESLFLNNPKLAGLKESWASYGQEEQNLITQLLEVDQAQLFEGWDAAGVAEDAKKAFFRELANLNNSYPGGLVGYISNARILLSKAKKGENLFDGFLPEQPDRVDLTNFGEIYEKSEALGRANFDKLAIVLVAGGLGERLGYSGIKLDIPVEVTVGTSYLAHYAANIKAFESRMDSPRCVPFIIMTSDDTNERTLASFEKNNWFGLKKEQVILLKQELVPAIADNDGHLALREKYKLILKPHGHGDVHMLLHSSGVAKKLRNEGIEYFVFIQDTNAQVFNAIPAAIGASVEKGYDFNSIAINRIPGEAVGAIVKLVGKDKQLTVNVEYNQLDSLLCSTVSPQGDVPNEQGFSMFPGNPNILVVKSSSYVKVLERTKGIIAEFVNPKYADESKCSFKKPTRLETMMQDLPKLFSSEEKVGVSIFNRQWAFSTNKNNLSDAAKKYAAGGPPESGASAESDFYLAGRMKLKFAVCKISEAPEEMFFGVPFTKGPRIILRPSFAQTIVEVREKIESCEISDEATLIIDGKDITLENVKISGSAALFIKACDGAKVVVKNLRVDNAGFELVKLSKEELACDKTPEYLRIRGYKIKNRGAKIYEFTEPGNYVVEE